MDATVENLLLARPPLQSSADRARRPMQLCSATARSGPGISGLAWMTATCRWSDGSRSSSTAETRRLAARDIGELLLAHDVVREAVTSGVPDAEYGERVEAAVVVTSSVTLAELSRHCADRLVRFKLPACVRVVREIPVGPTGKAARASVAPASWVHESRGSRRRRDWRLRGRNARSRGHRNAPRSRARSTSTRFAQKGRG